jgi:steroid delta-isomerase-like uncharacterized protein
LKRSLLAIPLAFLLCFAFGCQDKAAMAELEAFKAQAAVEEQNIELAKNVHLAWTKKDYELIRASCSPGMVYYSPSNAKQLDNLDELIEFADGFIASFPDYEIGIKEAVAKGDIVALRAVVTGIHGGDFMGIPATGNRIEFGQMLFFRVENGKIVEMREDFDNLGLMQQLGMELKPKEGVK